MTHQNLLKGFSIAILTLTSAFADGLPEPGLVLYGSVVNQHGGSNLRLTTGTLQWIIPKPGGGSVTSLFFWFLWFAFCSQGESQRAGHTNCRR